MSPGVSHFNHLAVVLLTVFHQAFSFAWYSLFASSWSAALPYIPEQMGSPGAWPYTIATLSSLGICYALAWLIDVTGQRNLKGGMAMAVMLWLGATAPFVATHHALMQVGWSALLLDIIRDLVLLLVSGATLGVWPAASSKSETPGG